MFTSNYNMSKIVNIEGESSESEFCMVLEPVSVNLSVCPVSNPYSAHLESSSVLAVCQQYNQLLDKAIELIIGCMVEKIPANLNFLPEITKIEKQLICVHAVINCRFVQKLGYLCKRCSSAPDLATLIQREK